MYNTSIIINTLRQNIEEIIHPAANCPYVHMSFACQICFIFQLLVVLLPVLLLLHPADGVPGNSMASDAGLPTLQDTFVPDESEPSLVAPRRVKRFILQGVLLLQALSVRHPPDRTTTQRPHYYYRHHHHHYTTSLG